MYKAVVFNNWMREREKYPRPNPVAYLSSSKRKNYVGDYYESNDRLKCHSHVHLFEREIDEKKLANCGRYGIRVESWKDAFRPEDEDDMMLTKDILTGDLACMIKCGRYGRCPLNWRDTFRPVEEEDIMSNKEIPGRLHEISQTQEPEYEVPNDECKKRKSLEKKVQKKSWWRSVLQKIFGGKKKD